MTYLTAYGTQRIALHRIAESIGVQTRQRGRTRSIAKPNNVIRVEAVERILGRDQGDIAKGMDAAQFDAWLQARANTYLGRNGWLLQQAQTAMRNGRNARRDAGRCWDELNAALHRASFGMVAAPSLKAQAKVLDAIEEHQRAAMQWFQAATILFDLYAVERQMQTAGIDTSEAEHVTQEALQEQARDQRQRAMASLPDMRVPTRKRK